MKPASFPLKPLTLFAILLILLLALAAWAPWVTSAAAEQHAVLSFESAWLGVADGCGFNCTGCGAKGSVKAPFGRTVTLEYACGMLPADSPEYHEQVTAFVSFLYTTHGLPEP